MNPRKPQPVEMTESSKQSIVSRALRLGLQAVNYTVFMVLVWYFSVSPSIQVRDADEAMVTVAFAHAGRLREPCRKLSNEELAQLAANMRTTEECPRERSPVVIEVLLDGDPIYSKTLYPPGLYEDGVVDVYFSRRIPAGDHQFEIRMDDSVRDEGFNHQLAADVSLQPGQILLVGYDNEQGFGVQ
jgi:hypothetical protein